MGEWKPFKKKSFACLVFFLLTATLLLPQVTGEQGVSSKPLNENHAPGLTDRFRYHRVTEELMNHRINRNGFLEGFLNIEIHTRCDATEKSRKLSLFTPDAIDIDNNNATGIDGKDIEAQVILFPWIELEPDIAIGFIVSLSVQRLGEEIKDKNVSVSLNITIGDTRIQLGYLSPDKPGNEVPESVTTTFMPLLYPFQQGIGFRLALIPQYDNGDQGNKTITLYACYSRENMERGFSLTFDPAIETQMEFKPAKEEGQWQYTFYRFGEIESKVTAMVEKTKDGKEKKVTVIINKLPKEMTFSLQVSPFTKGGGTLLYESTSTFDVDMRVETDELGICRYATIRRTPRRLYATWEPSLVNGSYLLSTESEGTTFILQDNLVDPIINLTVRNLQTIDLRATWNLTQPGNFTLIKTGGLNVNLLFTLDEWRANINTELTAELLSVSWHLNVSGHMGVDTNWDPATTTTIEIRSDELGFKITAETLKAEDFLLQWVLWPPQEWDISWSGEIDFFSLAIDIFVEGSWYHLWPPT
ncbi:MAG TPA: hypothetical protein ENI45_04165 [Thermoplasmatales archaeon]|nr:hypothetical protein [Thermoplasmatales archaeon]